MSNLYVSEIENNVENLKRTLIDEKELHEC